MAVLGETLRLIELSTLPCYWMFPFSFAFALFSKLLSHGSDGALASQPKLKVNSNDGTMNKIRPLVSTRSLG